MTTATQILNIARNEIGVRESPAGSNRTKYGSDYGWNGVAWCAIFIWWIFHQAGADNLLPMKTASCWQLMDAAKKKGLWVTSGFRSGDILIYDFPSGSSVDHTGICESVSGNSVTTIEGNTGVGNDANGGMVMRRTRKLSQVKGAVRPRYDAEKSVFLIAQEVVNGEWGNGDKRVERLTAAGYRPAEVQTLVNALYKGGIRVQITASVLNVREKPSTDSEILDRLINGSVLAVSEIKGGKGASAWGRINNGWISLDHVAVL